MTGPEAGILSRDQDGTEHRLHVADHPAGLVSIADDQQVRILAPCDAIALAVALIHATRGYMKGGGPLSSLL